LLGRARPEEDAVESAGETASPATAGVIPSPGLPTSVNGPEAGYVTPSGTLLSTTQLKDLAEEAVGYGVESKQTLGTIALEQTTLKNAIAEIEPANVPFAASSGYSDWLNSPVDLLVLRGSFTLSSAPVPPGQPAPFGKVLDLVVDAHTGWIDAIRTSSQSPASATKLEAMVAR
jgi:hypothetical protein